MDRIKDKIKEIQIFLFELKSIISNNLEEYESNLEKKAASERYFEKIIESSVDLAHLIAKKERLKLDEKNKIFDLLLEEEIINKNLHIKLKNAKGMRNIISHKYGEIDDKIVFESITKELIPDINEFLKMIQKTLNLDSIKI
jgi:uncharacterized protein YutE (UPF0331/DUF86 family)